MHIAVLAASGATGHQLAILALERGHTVTAIARSTTRLHLPASNRLTPVEGDVRDAYSIAVAVKNADVVLSGLGAVRGESLGILLAGAHAVVDAASARVLWLGAFGTGRSAEMAGALTRGVLRLALRSEVEDKAAADSVILAAGGTVFHAGPLNNGPLSATYRTVPLAEMRRRLIPASISRATVASAMIDEAESQARPGQILVPVRVSSAGRPAITN